MAVSDLDRFRDALPEAFVENRLPPLVEDVEEWEVVHIDDADDADSDPLMRSEDAGTMSGQVPVLEIGQTDDGDGYGTNLGPGQSEPDHPGGLVTRWKSSPVPPPDALAFYLPFHLFPKSWWGIYLIHEGVEWLAGEIVRRGKGKVRYPSAFVVARTFLYGHEQFHHVVESFATRLEVTHREALYRLGIDARFRQVFGTDLCREEALANAYGYVKAADLWPKNRKRVVEKRSALKALLAMIKDMPPGYRLGYRFIEADPFRIARSELGEEYQGAALPRLPAKAASIWDAFGHAFHPIANVRCT